MEMQNDSEKTVAGQKQYGVSSMLLAGSIIAAAVAVLVFPSVRIALYDPWLRWSDVSDFVAAYRDTPGQNFGTLRVGIISDIHSCAGFRSDLSAFVADIDSKATNFNVSLGDNISYGIGSCDKTAPDDLLWVKERLATASPFHFVLGDHDIYDQVSTFDYWLETTGMAEAFYSFDHGGYHILILDSVLGGEHTREECEYD
ncbi:MAG: metallophosphoesterase, partial [Candidatus Moranbacteria bacterium]|nr:metallophosphoesterase [Candidatus Moranbacteria bacterium]